MSEPTPTIERLRIPPGLAAVLWDFDGTLADTEPLWVQAEFTLVESLGGMWSEEHAKYMVGNSLLDSAAYILGVIERPDLDPAWVVDRLVEQVVRALQSRPIPWQPGALELLAALNADGIPCALVSASYRVVLEAMLSRLPRGSFAVTVAGDEVSAGKPHPEPYLAACRMLGVDPRACVVIEDSANGAAAGNASGALVLTVEHYVPVPPAPRRVPIESLTRLDPAGIARLLELANAAG